MSFKRSRPSFATSPLSWPSGARTSWRTTGSLAATRIMLPVLRPWASASRTWWSDTLPTLTGAPEITMNREDELREAVRHVAAEMNLWAADVVADSALYADPKEMAVRLVALARRLTDALSPDPH